MFFLKAKAKSTLYRRGVLQARQTGAQTASSLPACCLCRFTLLNRFLDHSVKHHHIHRIAHSHVALVVVQHDEPIGLHHGTEHA